jgi:hypothetical protein
MAWTLRRKSTGVPSVRRVATVKPVKPVKAVQPVRPVKSMAPVGYQYYWKPDSKR